MDYKGKVIMSPDVIAEKEIEYVFLTLTISVATEIIKDIKKKYKNVEILFAGDLIDSNFSLPEICS